MRCSKAQPLGRFVSAPPADGTASKLVAGFAQDTQTTKLLACTAKLVRLVLPLELDELLACMVSKY